MRTQLMIMIIVLTIVLVLVAAFVALVWWLGWVWAIVVAVCGLVFVVVGYWTVLKPWHMRWVPPTQKWLRRCLVMI